MYDVTPASTRKRFKEVITDLLEHNSYRFEIWLRQVAEGHDHGKPDPAKALEIVCKLAEFAAPKLTRQEITGNDGGPQVLRIQRTIVDPATDVVARDLL